MASQKIGALWKRKTQDGKTFLSGVIQDLRGDIQIAVFVNDRKEGEKQPDYNIVRSEQKEQREKTDNDDFLNDAPAKNDSSDEIRVEDIPFN